MVDNSDVIKQWLDSIRGTDLHLILRTSKCLPFALRRLLILGRILPVYHDLRPGGPRNLHLLRRVPRPDCRRSLAQGIG